MRLMLPLALMRQGHMAMWLTSMGTGGSKLEAAEPSAIESNEKSWSAAGDGSAVGMRKGMEVEVGADDRARLEAIVADRKSPQKHVWRARIVLLTADGDGTLEIMRQVGAPRRRVWRWQERFTAAGVDGLLRDKSRPPAAAAGRRWPSGWSS